MVSSVFTLEEKEVPQSLEKGFFSKLKLLEKVFFVENLDMKETSLFFKKMKSIYQSEA